MRNIFIIRNFTFKTRRDKQNLLGLIKNKSRKDNKVKGIYFKIRNNNKEEVVHDQVVYGCTYVHCNSQTSIK